MRRLTRKRPNRSGQSSGGFLFLLGGVLALVLPLAACGNGAPEPEPTTQPPAQQEEQEQAAQPAEQREQVRQEEAQEPAAPAAAQPAQQAEPEPPAEPQQEQHQQEEPAQPQQAQPQAEAAPAAPLGPLTLQAVPLFGGYQFSQPIEMAQLPDGSWLIAEQRGSLTRFRWDEADAALQQFGVLDLTDAVQFGGEQGLLSFALDPRFETEPFLYVYYSPSGGGRTRLSRFRYDLTEPHTALPESELIILEVPQPYPNHNGGAVRFGPDGYLYLGFGDGGWANDPQGHGQNRATLLGSIIRLDVSASSAAEPYRVPTDNPFLGVGGVRPETWAYGLRNPWRMAFDAASGDLWVGDVGQNRWEEVAIVRAGDNHGWNIWEGFECFGSDADCAALSEAAQPVWAYGRDLGCSVTGGEVYRGTAMPQLDGHFLFADYCTSRLWSVDAEGTVTEWLQLDDPIASFARDRSGELYVLTFNGPIYRLQPAE